MRRRKINLRELGEYAQLYQRAHINYFWYFGGSFSINPR